MSVERSWESKGFDACDFTLYSSNCTYDFRDGGIPVVRETWLSDSIEKEEPQPLGDYDIASDLSVGGKGVPLYQQDPSNEALETITSEVFVGLFLLIWF